MIAAPARLPSPHQGLPSTPWQALRRAAARISSFLEETHLRAVSRLRTFMAAIALALTPTPHRERLPAHRFRRRLAPPRPHSPFRDPQPQPSLHPSPPTPAKNHPAPPSVVPAKSLPQPAPDTIRGTRSGAGIHPHHGSTPLPAEERPEKPEEFFGKNSYCARDPQFPRPAGSPHPHHPRRSNSTPSHPGCLFLPRPVGEQLCGPSSVRSRSDPRWSAFGRGRCRGRAACACRRPGPPWAACRRRRGAGSRSAGGD